MHLVQREMTDAVKWMQMKMMDAVKCGAERDDGRDKNCS